VQQNPLDSSVALQQQKKLSGNGIEDSPPIKSLFDFKENQRFKKEESQASFNFTSFKNPFASSDDQRGLVLKPPTFQNPFKIPAPQSSSIFASGKSLFESSTLAILQKNN